MNPTPMSVRLMATVASAVVTFALFQSVALFAAVTPTSPDTQAHTASARLATLKKPS